MDEKMQTIGSVPLFKTLIWTRRYYEYGLYELHTSSSFFPLLNRGAFLYRSDRDELGLIENVEYSQDDKGATTCFAKGYFSEKLLKDRVVPRSVTIDGTPELIGRQLVQTYIIDPTDDRKIQNIALGEVSGIGKPIRMQATGFNISEKLYAIEATQEQSHRLKYDYLNNSMIFETWEGLDRRESQNVNSWAIFSNSFANIKNVVYERDISSYKNFAYVAGEGEGDARTIVEVDIRMDNNEKRREIYVDARDLQSKDVNGNIMSAVAYRETLYQRGLEKLDEYRKIEIVNSSVDPMANLEYRVDFDLGDLCTYINTDVEIESDERITEVQEVYEGGKETISVIFGNDEATSITKIIKREVT